MIINNNREYYNHIHRHHKNKNKSEAMNLKRSKKDLL